MSAKTLKHIIGRAVVDSAFRETLLKTPHTLVEEYDLTGEELASLRGLTTEMFDTLAGELDERISRVVAIGDESNLVAWLQQQKK